MKFKDWINPIISGAVSSLVLWMLTEFKEVTMKHIYSFIITFSPVIIGLLVFCIHLFIKDYKRFRRVVIGLYSESEGGKRGKQLARDIIEMQKPMLQDALQDAYDKGKNDASK